MEFSKFIECVKMTINIQPTSTLPNIRKALYLFNWFEKLTVSPFFTTFFLFRFNSKGAANEETQLAAVFVQLPSARSFASANPRQELCHSALRQLEVVTFGEEIEVLQVAAAQVEREKSSWW